MGEMQECAGEVFHECSINGTAPRSGPLAFVEGVMIEDMGEKMAVPNDAKKEIEVRFQNVNDPDFVNARVSN